MNNSIDFEEGVSVNWRFGTKIENEPFMDTFKGREKRTFV